MSDLPFKALLKRLYRYLIKYATSYLQYLQYESAERIIKSIAYVVSNVLTFFLVGIFLNITFLALVFAIGIAMGALPMALVIIGSVYLLLSIFLVVFRKPLILRPLQNQLVALIFSDPPN